MKTTAVSRSLERKFSMLDQTRPTQVHKVYEELESSNYINVKVDQLVNQHYSMATTNYREYLNMIGQRISKKCNESTYEMASEGGIKNHKDEHLKNL